MGWGVIRWCRSFLARPPGYRLSSLRDEEVVTEGCTASAGRRSGEEVVAAAEE